MKNPDKMNPRQRLCHLLMNEPDISSGWWLEPEKVWDEATKEGVGALIWQRYHDLGDEDLRQAMHELFFEDVRLQKIEFTRQSHALNQILRELNQDSIPVICMRGLAVSELLYQPPYLRISTDIDLLYEEEHSLLLKQTLGNKLGFIPAVKYDHIFVRGNLPVDLHTEPLGIERIRAWAFLTPLRAADFFKHAQQGELAGEKALLLHARVHLPYLCFHALKHSFSRLLWLYDIALYANQVAKEGLWDEVLAGIVEYKLERPCYYALSYVRKHLAAAVPQELLDGIRPAMGMMERRLFNRFMKHEVIPYLAERLFSRMQPDFLHRVAFWRETIYPRLEVREQIAGSGCTKCNFTRQRLKIIFGFLWPFKKRRYY